MLHTEKLSFVYSTFNKRHTGFKQFTANGRASDDIGASVFTLPVAHPVVMPASAAKLFCPPRRYDSSDGAGSNSPSPAPSHPAMFIYPTVTP